MAGAGLGCLYCFPGSRFARWRLRHFGKLAYGKMKKSYFGFVSVFVEAQGRQLNARAHHVVPPTPTFLYYAEVQAIIKQSAPRRADLKHLQCGTTTLKA